MSFLWVFLAFAADVNPEAVDLPRKLQQKRVEQCMGGDAAACLEMADAAQRAMAVSIVHASHNEAAPAVFRHQQAHAFLDAACDAGSVSACVQRTRWAEACELGDADACELFVFGDDLRRVRACGWGDDASCASRGELDFPIDTRIWHLDETLGSPVLLDGAWLGVYSGVFAEQSLVGWTGASSAWRAVRGPLPRAATALDSGGFAGWLPKTVPRRQDYGDTFAWSGRFPVQRFLVGADGELEVRGVRPEDHALCGEPAILPSGHAVFHALEDPRACEGGPYDGSRALSWVDIEAGTATIIEGVGPVAPGKRKFAAADGWLAVLWSDRVDVFALDGTTATLARSAPMDRPEQVLVSSRGTVAINRFSEFYLWLPESEAPVLVAEGSPYSALQDLSAEGDTWMLSYDDRLQMYRGTEPVFDVEVSHPPRAVFGVDTQQILVAGRGETWMIDLAGRPWASETSPFTRGEPVVVPSVAPEIDRSRAQADLVIAGRVVRNGKPIVGATVALVPNTRLAGVQRREVQSGPGGAFQFEDVPRVSQMVEASHKLWFGSRQPSLLERAGGDLELKTQFQAVSGRVTTPEGVAVAGASVIARLGTRERLYTDETDEEGLFRIVVPKGRYLALEVSSAEHGVATLDDKISGEGGDVHRYDVVVERTQRRKVLVLDALGAPAEGVDLEDKKERIVGHTDAEGRYEDWQVEGTDPLRPTEADHRWPLPLRKPQRKGDTDVWTQPTRVSLPALKDMWSDGVELRGPPKHIDGRVQVRSLQPGALQLVRWTEEGPWLASATLDETEASIDPEWTTPEAACTTVLDDQWVPLAAVSIDVAYAVGPSRKVQSELDGSLCIPRFSGEVTLTVEKRQGLREVGWKGSVDAMPVVWPVASLGARARDAASLPLGVTFEAVDGGLLVTSVDANGLWADFVEPGWLVLEGDGEPILDVADLLARVDETREAWPLKDFKLLIAGEESSRSVNAPSGGHCSSTTLARLNNYDSAPARDLELCPAHQPIERLLPYWGDPIDAIVGTWQPVNPIAETQLEAVEVVRALLAAREGGDPVELIRRATQDPAVQTEAVGFLAMSRSARHWRARQAEIEEAAALAAPIEITATSYQGVDASFVPIAGGVLVQPVEPLVGSHRLWIAGQDTLVLSTSSLMTGRGGVTVLRRM